MDLNAVLTWSILLTVCILALFVEAALFFRALYLTRQTLWRYLLLLIPLAGCIWSFTVVQAALRTYGAVSFSMYMHHTHFSAFTYSLLIAPAVQAILACQFQTAITLAIFVAILFIEKRLLPRVQRPPVWVFARSGLSGL